MVGTIQQEWTLIYPQFVIKDEAGNPVLRIEGPLCPISCCSDVDFKVKSVQTGSEVRDILGYISGEGEHCILGYIAGTDSSSGG